VDDHHIIVGIHIGKGLRKPVLERLALAAILHGKRGIILIFLQLEHCRNNVETGEIRPPDDLANRLPFGIVTNSLIERGKFVEFRLNAMQGGKRSLRIEIDGKDAMAGQGHMLRQMRSRRGFAGAALEVDDADNLKLFIAATMRNVALDLSATVLVEPLAQFLNLLDTIGAATACQNGRLDSLALKM